MKYEGSVCVTSCENLAGLKLKEQIILDTCLGLCEVLLQQSTSVSGGFFKVYEQNVQSL